jgi:hypothetical protein
VASVRCETALAARAGSPIRNLRWAVRGVRCWATRSLSDPPPPPSPGLGDIGQYCDMGHCSRTACLGFTGSLGHTGPVFLSYVLPLSFPSISCFSLCSLFSTPSSLPSFLFHFSASLSPLFPSFLPPSFRHVISLFLPLYKRFSSYLPP